MMDLQSITSSGALGLPPDRVAGRALKGRLMVVAPNSGRAIIAVADQHAVTIEKWRTNCAPEQMVLRVKARHYDLRHLEDFQTPSGLPELVVRTEKIADAMRIADPAPLRLLIDITEIGAASAKLWKASSLVPITVTLTSGRAEAGSGREFDTALHLIQSAFNAVLEGGRMRISTSLAGRFNEDALRAVALLVWYAERQEMPFRFFHTELFERF